MRQRLSPFLAAALALLVGLGIEILLERAEQETYVQHRRAEIINRISTIRARLEGELNADLLLTRGIVAHVANDPDISFHEFTTLARELMARRTHIRNIALARGNVITHIYPLAGNEAALGFDYMTSATQRATVERAMKTRETAIAGPLEIVQGGTALISRTPIWTTPPGGEPGSGAYWGVVSMPIVMDSLFRDAGLQDPDLTMHIAIRGTDGKGAAGDVFFGPASVFDDDPILMDINLPGGSWRMAALPKDGWDAASPGLWRLRAAGLAATLLVSLLVYLLFRDQQRIHHLALHDMLTGLANRTLLADRIGQSAAKASRAGKKFAVLHLDLDDFKPINDRFGHGVGDMVLMEVGSRLRQSVRSSDTVARIGGDEFVVVLPDLSNRDDASVIAAKIVAALGRPIPLAAKTSPSRAGAEQCRLGVSIGIAISPDDGDDAEILIRHADEAMYRAKQNGKNNFTFYSNRAGCAEIESCSSSPGGV